MGLKVWCGIALLATAIASQPAAGGDRKSFRSSTDNDLFAERFMPAHSASASVSHAPLDLSPVTAFDSRPEHFVENRTNGHVDGREHASGPIDRKIRLFHFNTKFGEVGVHPLLGSAKGLQFSLGF